MKYTVEQLNTPDDKDIADILNLFRGIPGRTCTASVYADYVNTQWSRIAFFITRKDGEMVGFTQAEAPNMLDPKAAWLPFSHATTDCPFQYSKRAVKMAEKWMKERGATKYKLTTVRNAKAMERKWKIKRSNEVLMEKDIS